jgi:4-methyl-5(b-hydroxyethyl)-thiazole monophosphate biosynthesis
MVYIIIGTGFEEIEALTVCDILRRGGVDLSLAGVGGRHIKGGHGIEIFTDLEVSDIKTEKAKMLIIPGGLKGVENIENSAECSEIIKKAADEGVALAAICAGPRALAKLGLLNGKRITCYPGMEDEMTGALVDSTQKAVKDENIITGKAAGAAADFAFEILKTLKGGDIASKIKAGMYYE